MSLARILTVCDAIAANIAALWAPSPPSAVQRVYQVPIGDADAVGATAIQGRQVYVFPTTWETEPATRGTYYRDHEVTLVVAERYLDAAGDAPNAWMDVRVTFVEQIIWLPLADRKQPKLLPDLYPMTSRVEVCSLDDLVQQKLFLSVVSVTLREEI